jgi:hypothetical protein
VGLERDPLSLASTIEKLLGRRSSGSGLESRKYGRRERHADHVAKVGTNFADKRWSLGRTKATVFVCLYYKVYTFHLDSNDTVYIITDRFPSDSGRDM